MPLRSIAHRLTLALAILAVPTIVHAAGAGFLIEGVVLKLIKEFSDIWLIITVLSVVLAGFSLMLSSDEGHLTKVRSAVIAIGIGAALTTVLLTIGKPVIGWLYTGKDTLSSTNYDVVLSGTGPTSIGGEAEGFAGWITSMAAVVGVLIVIITALRAFMSFGGDENSHTNVRRSVLHVIFGLIIIGGAYLIRKAFFAPTFLSQGGIFSSSASFAAVGRPDPLMELIKNKFTVILGIITTIAVGILIYAGVRMVASFGNEEHFNAAKSLMIRVLIGLLIISLSFALVWIVVTAFH